MLLRAKLMAALRTSGSAKLEKMWADQKRKQIEHYAAKRRS